MASRGLTMPPRPHGRARPEQKLAYQQRLSEFFAALEGEREMRLVEAREQLARVAVCHHCGHSAAVHVPDEASWETCTVEGCGCTSYRRRRLAA